MKKTYFNITKDTHFIICHPKHLYALPTTRYARYEQEHILVMTLYYELIFTIEKLILYSNIK